MKYQTLKNSCCAVFKMLGGCWLLSGGVVWWAVTFSGTPKPPLSLSGRTGSRKRAILAMRRITLSTKNAKKSRIRAKWATLTAKQLFVLQLSHLLRENAIQAAFGRYLDVWGRRRPPRPVVCVQRYCAVVLPHSWLAGSGHHHITRITRGG